MGYNTTLMILNDGFGELEKHPEQFVKKVRDVMDFGGTIGVGNHGNVVEVMKTEHADVPRLYFTHQNSIIELSPYNKDTMELATSDREYLRDWIKNSIAKARHMLLHLEKEIDKREGR